MRVVVGWDDDYDCWWRVVSLLKDEKMKEEEFGVTNVSAGWD